MKERQPRFLARFLRQTSLVAPNELSVCVLSFLMVFLLMGSYYVLRPVRDGFASDWTDAEVSFLWTLNFFLSTAVVALFGWVVKRLRFDFLVPSVYAFFSVSFALFYLGTAGSDGQYKILIDKIFYVWVSLFSLFNISVFWSFMSDLYSKEQAGRLFPLIGTGASAGAILGPAIPTLFAAWIGTERLVLLTSFLLLLTIPLTLIILRLKTTRLGSKDFLTNAKRTHIGGNPLQGFRAFFTNRYFLSIGIFIMLYTAISSILYFEQKNLLAAYNRIERTQILGAVDWIVNILTFSIAFFATGRIVKYCGMPFTLSSMPFITSFGFLFLAAAPILSVALFFQVLRRAGEYAITRPSREMLFTLVNREDRFKTKPVIDVVAYRGGDMVTSWAFAALTEGVGLGIASMAAIGAIVAAIWGLIALFLGNWFDRTQQPK
jgi:AAA family ATP:ADP antiporter